MESNKRKKHLSPAQLLVEIIKNRGFTTKKTQHEFLSPKPLKKITSRDVAIDEQWLESSLNRIKKAVIDKESIVVYADYDADGITAGAIMWETLHRLGARVMPYIPHRVEEGYGFSLKGIDTVMKLHHPALVISVDHGITAREKVIYAKSLGIDVVITDHHVLPKKLPDTFIVHTTLLSGAGVSWFVARQLLREFNTSDANFNQELIALAAIGTIADMVPLVGANRSIAKYGLEAINQTERVGLKALLEEAGVTLGKVKTYEISHILAPRLNAMGRLLHALDALRLLCTKNTQKARELAQKLGLTNRERQELMLATTIRAKEFLSQNYLVNTMPKLLFVSHATYNQGVIGLVAGKLVEEYYLPAVVVARGEMVSKASARSINGFNIVEAIRSCSDIVVEVGGHPMAAGFTVETRHLERLKARLESLAAKILIPEKLEKILIIETELSFKNLSLELAEVLAALEPYGFGNPQPIFASLKTVLNDARLIGKDGRHLRLHCSQDGIEFTAVGFGMGDRFKDLSPGIHLDLAYALYVDTWNGTKKLQLKLRDFRKS